jgi:hypothetical protein
MTENSLVPCHRSQVVFIMPDLLATPVTTSDEVQGMAHGLATAAATKAKSVIPALRRVDVYQVLNFGKLLF